MPFRPALRPGALVLRRDAGHLQVGTSPGVVVADRPGLHRLLLRLDGAHDLEALRASCPDVADLDAVIRDLRAAGVVVDATGWDARHLDESRSLALHPGGSVADRRRFGVSLHHDPGTRSLVQATVGVLGAAGVVRTDIDDPDLLVVAASGEPARDVFAAATRARLPHLVVRVDEDRVLIGPLVLPGASPCVDCHDLHRADWDPAWAALVPQLGNRGAQHNPPAPGALVLHTAAVEIAAVVLAAADRAPLPWLGRVGAVGPTFTERAEWPVAFHHRCACGLLPAA